jgi:hypothetical protein
MLRIAEGACGGLERHERNARVVAPFGLPLDDAQSTRQSAAGRGAGIRSRDPQGRYASDAIHALTTPRNGTSFMYRTKISSF